ncbi:Ubiquitin-conjugating enzyme E2 34 [Pleodorina starrii]|uniref:E2 ubiquitin-conjugating enzyme n=1 Tax=Pleodorina starrii TaxID=330485 RepID=A0A9W6BLX4_9CHLO|nr:Ubiquitin-conjugating enzyme E2 34 [Pleodorina starrii]GLC54504.1 Ubiquitin-conjugating enzyme E2 34 [Pleodorina starrii]GLC76118.1 Ubiquitin-conjugating enzyme E2 34 [Pleodorina starrii]
MAGANKQCMTRLQKEYKSLLKDPVPNITAHPSPSNLLEWHFVLEGAKGTEYEGGVYHGKLVFPPEYPFKPPSISLFTPNGRFATNTKLCLSMTDYHPESWNPMWSVGTILTGLLSFMYDTQSTTGSITTTKQDKERMARESLAFNIKNPTFRKLFPSWVEELSRRTAAEAAQPATAPQAQPLTAKSESEDADQQPQQNGQAPVPSQAEGAAAAAGQRLEQQPQRRPGHHPPQPFGNTIVTLAIVVAVLAAVWVSSSNPGRDMLRSWAPWPGAGAGRSSS